MTQKKSFMTPKKSLWLVKIAWVVMLGNFLTHINWLTALAMYIVTGAVIFMTQWQAGQRPSPLDMYLWPRIIGPMIKDVRKGLFKNKKK
jgi:hypothetical protein